MSHSTLAGPLCWADVPDSAVLQAFHDTSNSRRQTLHALGVEVGQHMLRVDVPEALARVAGQQELSGASLPPILRCFLLDTGATISWPEFERSWRALQQLTGGGPGPCNQTRSSKPKTLGGRAAGQAQGQGQAQVHLQPLTHQQEVGWHHALVPPQPKTCGDGYAPLRSSDITRGNEGRSVQTYFGMHL